MKSRKLQFLAFVLFLSTISWTTAHAQITPLGDAYTNSADPTTNYGASTLLSVDGATQVAYIQFNLSSIPATASISQATLKLYVNSVTTAGSFNVDYVSGSWSESKITYDLAPALGTTIASNVALTTASKNQYILIDVTAAVQAWLSGSEPNDGIALVANGTFNATFDSKENTTTSHPAELDIAYAGGDGTITGVTTPSGSGLSGGGTNGTLNLSLTNACAANQVLQWSGSAWACSSAATGTITGIVTAAGSGLSGGGTNGTLTLVNTGLLGLTPSTGIVLSSGNVPAIAINTSVVPQLNATNTFTGNQTVNGNLSATGAVTGSGFQIGSNPLAPLFGYGNFALGNAFLGFAGNTTTMGHGNTASGAVALASNTTGNSNTASGGGALENNTEGYANTASGYQALLSNTTGFGNTASGGAALENNTTGAANTASGEQALINSTTGGNNTASGNEALYSNTTGSFNTATGNTALYYNTTGGENTGNGFGAGNTADQSPMTGSYNSFLGYSAALSSGSSNGTPISNAAAIGAYSEVTESNAMVLGSISGVNGCTSPCASTNVGIGTTTPAYTLDVHGTGNFTGLVTFASGQTFPGTVSSLTAGPGLSESGTNGAVTLSLASNACAAGNALTALPFTCSPVASLATNTFTGNQTVDGNVGATGGVSGSTVSSASTYYLSGYAFDYGNASLSNAYLGFGGDGAASTGSFNTGVGSGALAKNTGGIGNTATGVSTLYNNGYGLYNTASGFNALFLNSSGSYNVANGYEALSVNTGGIANTASGSNALVSNSTGNNNTASGYNALYWNSTGSNNTAVGYQAGNTSNGTVTTGSGNTFVGSDALSGTVTNLTNATAIGANSEVTASNALILGSTAGINGATATPYVGIGTTAPRSALDINANVPEGLGPTVTLTNNGGGGEASLDFNTYAPSTTGAYNPAARIEAIDGANGYPFSDYIYFWANEPGNPNQILQNTMWIDPLGDVAVMGTLYKSGGSFKIDHPLDPANKYLYHSFVESPDMKNIYDGVATLDANGEAIIEMPDWFSVLNRDFRYQLTCIGGFAPVYVAEELANNQFKIGGGRGGMRVSWQITGIRQDPWANAHRIPVEEVKDDRELGFYLHPELYGEPKEKGISSVLQARLTKKAETNQQNGVPTAINSVAPGRETPVQSSLPPKSVNVPPGAVNGTSPKPSPVTPKPVKVPRAVNQ